MNSRSFEPGASRSRFRREAARGKGLTEGKAGGNIGGMNPVLSKYLGVLSICGVALLIQSVSGATAFEGKPLWEEGAKNPIAYEQEEIQRSRGASGNSRSGHNRVFSRVSEPTYVIHRAAEDKANGVGMVICPGGGYVDVWLDREGHDVGLWLAENGITALVLKYRTNHPKTDERGESSWRVREYDWDTYLPAAVSDARRSVALLRRRAEELKLDPEKIGIGGFSAGGHLSFSAGFDSKYWVGEYREQGQPDFVGLIYPWLWDGFEQVVADAPAVLPTFVINGLPDRLTPAHKCLDLTRALMEREAPVELHIYTVGRHGFGLAEGNRAKSVGLWRANFLAWLRDTKLIAD